MKGLRRTFQFIPSNNPGMLMSAAILGADSIIFDLEDAVSITEKDAAARLLAEALETFDYSAIEVVVRVNPMDTTFGPADLQTLKGLPIDALMVPKATLSSISHAITLIDAAGFTCSIIPLVESAQGVEEVGAIIDLDHRIDGILLGGEDLTSDLGVVRTKLGNEIDYSRKRVVTACKSRKITCIDTPWTDVEDLEGLKKDTEYAQALGFTSKSSINPRHLDPIHEVFAPKKNAVIYALSVMEARDLAEAEGKGVFSLNGKMVDAPVIARAQATLDLATALGLVKDGEYVGE